MNGKTDAKGRFSFNQVCAGPIQLNANTPNGGYGSVCAEGGDTNITVHLGVRESYPRQEPPPRSPARSQTRKASRAAKVLGEPVSLLLPRGKADGQRRPLHTDIRPQRGLALWGGPSQLWWPVT